MNPRRSHKILLVAAKLGYQTRSFEDAARRLAVELRYATDRCHVLDNPWGDDAIALRFEQPEDAAAAIAAAEPHPGGIVAVGDRPAHIAALAAHRLRLPWSPPDAVAAARNKNEARRRFAAAGLPVPEFFRVPLSAGPLQAAARAPYPCVLKPLGLSASRGVIRAGNRLEFIHAFERIAAILEQPEIRQMQEDQDRFLQVEHYIPGVEYALEGILTHGRLQVHAIFDKPDDLRGPFFEETIYVTPSRASEALQAAIVLATETAVEALGLTHGPIHAEMRVHRSEVWVLEVAARPIGGICSRSLRFTGEASLEELILRHALGEPVTSLRREPEASGVMMIPIPRNGVYRGVTGVEAASAVAGVWSVEITAKEGQKLQKLPEGSTYLGFLFARAEHPAEVEAALRQAHTKLEFDIAPELPILPPEPTGARKRRTA
jgi:biotin carboxylase